MTPSEIETLKMFDETMYQTFGFVREEPKKIKDFLLTQIRLARADERKQAYEDGKNAAVDYIESKLHNWNLPESIEETIDIEVVKNWIESARLPDVRDKG